MGKIVKYCNSCEESFAEKFSFCPICGDPIKAFEMNPVGEEVEADMAFPEKTLEIIEAKTKEVVIEPLEIGPAEEPIADEKVELPETIELLADDRTFDFDEPEIALEIDDEVEIEEIAPIAMPNVSVFGNDAGSDEEVSAGGYQSTIDYSHFQPIDSNLNNFDDDDDDFHVTVLTEKNVKERNLLLLGTMVIVLTLSIGVVIGSIFNHPLLVDAIGDDYLVAFVPIVEETPMTVEDEQKKKDDEDGGGGGGGGRDEQTPTSKGRLANQTPNPLINPDTSILQRNAELLQPVASTQGDNKIRTPTDERYGDPNSTLALLSNGLGTGGGQGSGTGTGQGSGRGTGQGSGIGSGSGSGIGDGTGPGRGSGGGNDGDNPPIRPTAGPTKGLNILLKPEPKYTDAARQNNIQGQVVLRITFLSNGQIGSISPVSGLSYGLTEQAIAAARQIRFEPAVRNGQPISVTKTFQYRFAIY